MNAREVECRVQFPDLMDDVVASDGGVLNVGPGLAVEVQGFLKIECDDCGTRELQEEISQCADRNLPRNSLGLGRRQAAIAFEDFVLGLGF